MNVDFLLSEADRLMRAATEEMNRSEEDVTSHLVCMNSRQSIVNYLIAFLKKNGVALKYPVTMAGLMAQCREIDGRFDLIDLTPINCRNKTDDTNFCLEVDVVRECLHVAIQTRAITLDEAPAY